MTKYQKGFYDIKNFRDYKVVGEDIDYAVIVDDEKKEIVLQFKESDSKEDWKHNLTFLPWLLKLDNNYIVTTRGYACAYKSASNKPVDDFCKAIASFPEYRKVIRGWSFGSAMSKIAVRHYYYRTKSKVDEIYTYGDVKCMFNPFVHLSIKNYAKLSYNFIYINDFVTWQVPFYWRMSTCRVGDRFSFKKLFNSGHNHCYYEEYDYSKYE